jgi:uncharacterized tellurite resistance protein B-like protein
MVDARMHILIAFITAVASLLYALERLGVDLGWLNPWAWGRRRRWLQQVHANPAFALSSPMEALALLLTATAKIDGEISLEEKNGLLKIFEETFKQSGPETSALLRSSTFILGDGEEVYQRPGDVLAQSLDKFSPEQKESTLELLAQVAAIGDAPTTVQRDFIAQIKVALTPGQEEKSGWQ